MARPDLSRFVDAQSGGMHERALAELWRGRKTSHWMWFVFPQLVGLGSSSMARRYALASLEEASAYLEHPVLGARLRECVEALLGVPSSSSPDPVAVMGSSIDAQKLRSSMTLFLRADPAPASTSSSAGFAEVLDRYFGGEADPRTDAALVAQAAWSACVSSKLPSAECGARLRAFADARGLDDDARAGLVDAIIEQMHLRAESASPPEQSVLDDRWFAIANRPLWEQALLAD